MTHDLAPASGDLGGPRQLVEGAALPPAVRRVGVARLVEARQGRPVLPPEPPHVELASTWGAGRRGAGGGHVHPDLLGELADRRGHPGCCRSLPTGTCATASVPEEERFALTGQGALARSSRQRRQSKAARAAVAPVHRSPTASPMALPGRDEPMYATHMLAEDILGPAVAGRASRARHGARDPSGCRISQVVDGDRRSSATSVPTEAAVAAVRLPQDGSAGLDRRGQAATAEWPTSR